MEVILIEAVRLVIVPNSCSSDVASLADQEITFKQCKSCLLRRLEIHLVEVTRVDSAPEDVLCSQEWADVIAKT
jgi:hypothetical protein